MPRPVIHSYGFDTRLGHILIAGDARGVRVIVLCSEDDASSRMALSESLESTVLSTSNPNLVRASRQINAYLEGEREVFSFDVNIEGTPFQRRVWRALCRVPYGQTCSYQDLAQAIGRPTAVRAVASACGQNPLPLVIPCHRVVNADGSIGGFSAGTNKKRQLLNLERAGTTHLPLFKQVVEDDARRERARTRTHALAKLNQPMADWLRVQLRDEPESPDIPSMTPEAWLADVLEQTTVHDLSILAESIAHCVSEEENKILRQVAEELTASCLTLALLDDDPLFDLCPSLRAAAQLDSPAFEITCRRLLTRLEPRDSRLEQVAGLLRKILDGSLSVSNRLRNRAVDLWVLVENQQHENVWTAATADDPSAVYAANGLWREAIVIAENSLTLGQHDPITLLTRISELHEKLGELPEAHDATLRLATLHPSSDIKKRLRYLVDRIEDKATRKS